MPSIPPASSILAWQWSNFSSLSAVDFYQIAKARQEVFIIEQNCLYPDIDDLDLSAWHLMAWDEKPASVSLAQEQHQVEERSLQAYLRVIAPNQTCTEPCIGRVLTVKAYRGQGLARQLMTKALDNIRKTYPGLSIRLSAQLYLQSFYEGFGFNCISEAYEEDGIAHIDMLKK